MKKQFEIKNRFTGGVLFSIETTSPKVAVEAAVSSGAYLGDAYLRGAYLGDADLRGAYLRGADLGGAKYGDGIPITKEPIQLIGLHYFVLIFDEHMKIGCELHSLEKWFSFDTKRIIEMDGKAATNFWDTWKEPLRNICKSSGRMK